VTSDDIFALRAAGRLSTSLVAVERNELIGHVAFSPVTIDGAATGVELLADHLASDDMAV